MLNDTQGHAIMSHGIIELELCCCRGRGNEVVVCYAPHKQSHKLVYYLVKSYQANEAVIPQVVRVSESQSFVSAS